MISDVGVSAGVTAEFAVRGMTCGSCAARIQRTLGKQPGVASAEVNYATATAQVVLTELPAPAAAGAGLLAGLVAAVAKTGYQLTPLTALAGSPRQAAGESTGSPGRLDGAAGPVEPTRANPPPGHLAPPAGEQAPPPLVEPPDDGEARAERGWFRRLLFGAPFAVAVGVLAMVPGPWTHQPVAQWAGWVEFALATPVQFVMGWPFLREAARRARYLAASMDT